MARLARLTLPGYPHHVIQRGNNRQAIFADDADRRLFLNLLGEYAHETRVEVHAYVLMENHYHLLLTPPSEAALAPMMQALGRRYVRHFNDTYHRSGTLWDGRYKSTVLQPERYLLACMVYIDLNPVRAGLVAQAGDYPWSSFRHYAGRDVNRLLSPHPLVWALGNTPFEREAAYADLVRVGISAVQQQVLTDAALSGWALGEQDFVEHLQTKTTRRVARASPGRPRLELGKNR